MAKINILKKNGETIYPGTIPQAVVDPTTGKNITEIFATKSVATSSSLGLIKSGPDVEVGGDGSVTVNNRIIPKMYKMGVNTKYKLFSILSGRDKASITFSILSPVLSGGLGYAKYITYKTYEGATVKNWSIRCIYATDSSMYNRIKLVRTGDATFDVYYQSNTGNDYCTFILDETTQTDLEIVAVGVSSIPEDIYKESEYAPIYLGEIHGTLKGNADTATKATQDANGNNIASTYLPKTGGTISGDIQFSDYGASGERGIKGIMGKNDYWGIVGKSEEDNQGYLEIFTGDDAGTASYNEIVKFAQYSGTRTESSSPVREFIIFDKEGNSSTPGKLTVGKLTVGKQQITIKSTNNKEAYVFTDDNAGRGIVLRLKDSSGNWKELGMWNDGSPYWATNYDKRYSLYHAGNLVNATTSKAGLMSSSDKSKLDSLSIVSRTETDINSDVFETPGIYIAPISSIDVDTVGFAETIDLLGSSIIMTVGQTGTNVRYQYIFCQEETGSYLYYRMFDPISLAPTPFYSVLPDIATSNKAGLVKSGGDITVGGDGIVSVNKTDTIKFNNSSDAINIDNYPQNDYGTITIWYNDAQADRSYSPGTEGVIYQTKYKSEQGDGGSGYVDCLTQLYVGSGGIKQRTVIDYDAANPFDGIPWS